MLSYLKPTYLRIFIQPLSGLKWRSFVSNNGRAEGQYSSQYGLDFSGNSVTTAEQYKAAVANLRDSARTQSFFDWLTNRKEVDWARLLTRLSTTEPGVTGKLYFYTIHSRFSLEYTPVLFNIASFSAKI